MAAKQKARLDRIDLYEEMKRRIESSSNQELEISSNVLADYFEVQASTIDYHLKKLIEEGHLVKKPKSKEEKRKPNVYLLPGNSENNNSTPELKVTYNQKSLGEMTELLKKKLSTGINSSEDKEVDTFEQNETQREESHSLQETNQDDDSEEQTTPSIQESAAEYTPSTKNPYTPTEETLIDEPAQSSRVEEQIFDFPDLKQDTFKGIQNLTLDDRIESFINQSKSVASAEQLLTKQDREVLSVMNESIQQNIIYLKDLSEQLSTVQNKELIQSLIDDRNHYMDENQKLKEENEALNNQLSENKGKYDLDPQRIRLIQQNLLATLDSYIEQPNHALALNRKEFRNNFTELINDAFRYILALQK